MVDLFNDFATNAVTEIEGTWHDYSGDVSFLIARAGNKAYARAFLKAYEASRRVLETKGPTAEAKAEEVTVKTLAKAILLGWRGDLKYKGEPLPYSLENAEKILAHVDFRKWVVERSEDMSKYKIVQDEEDAKN